LNNGKVKEMANVLEVPKLWKNLFFTKQVNQVRKKIVTKIGNCIFINSKRLEIVECILEANLYKLVVMNKLKHNVITIPTTSNINIYFNLWHLHLSHINQQILTDVQTKSLRIGSFNESNLTPKGDT